MPSIRDRIHTKAFLRINHTPADRPNLDEIGRMMSFYPAVSASLENHRLCPYIWAKHKLLFKQEKQCKTEYYRFIIP